MKKYFTGIAAIIVAVGAVAFTAPENEKTTLVDHYYRYNTGSPLVIGSYIELDNSGGTTAAEKYEALSCSEGEEMCGIVTNTTSPTLTNDGNGFPQENSSVLQSDQKE